MSIGDSAFRGCPATIMNLQSVTTIDDYVFCNCPNLVIVDFLPNAISIGNGAFVNCSALATVNLPKVTSIGFN
ncbi:MAG: leucine-rich repeat protein, partial [Eubacterium sp.]